MKRADIQRVERALSVKLPSDYQQLLIDYPFSEDSAATAGMVIRDPDALIKVNEGPDTHFMIHHREGRWVPQKNHFLIGNDGGEDRYYLDLDDSRSGVLKFNLETGEMSHYANGMADFKSKVDQVDREIEDDEKRAADRRKNSKWWEFWKKL